MVLDSTSNHMEYGTSTVLSMELYSAGRDVMYHILPYSEFLHSVLLRCVYAVLDVYDSSVPTVINF